MKIPCLVRDSAVLPPLHFIGTLVSKKTGIVECVVVRMVELVYATITLYLRTISKWISPSSSFTFKLLQDSILSKCCGRWYLWPFLFCLVKSYILNLQCVAQCVYRILSSICFSELYLRWYLYHQKWWCHPIARQIEEPHLSQYHSSFVCLRFSFSGNIC